MRPWLAIVLVGCGSASAVPDGGSDAGSTSELVAAHNAVRAAAMPAPSPALPPVSWSDAVASIAAGWAENCQFMHNAMRGDVGENIFAGTGKEWSGTDAIDSWATEKQHYTLASNSCAAGKVCGHYTQLVWRSSTEIGCASKLCTTNNPFGGTQPWTFLVCDYAPPGNVVGSKPY
jgi:pathogenesis-related protein 1